MPERKRERRTYRPQCSIYMYSFPIRFILQSIDLDVIPQRLYHTRPTVLLDAQHTSKVRMNLELLRIVVHVQNNASFGGLVAHASDCEAVERWLSWTTVPLEFATTTDIGKNTG